MKWIKHQTATRRDEKIARLIGDGGEAGMARYGLYWAVQEIIADQMEGSDPSCSVIYPISVWSHLLVTRASLVERSLLTLAVTGLVTVERHGSDIRVTNCNLLKYRDDYSRKSGHAPDKVQLNTELEQSKNKKQKIHSSPKRKRSEPKHSTDPRHVACKTAIFAYYQAHNAGEDPDWEGREGKALGMLLGANPKLTEAGMIRLLDHRARSEVNHSDRPSKWIGSLKSFRNGPLDRFGKPLEIKNGKLSKTDQMFRDRDELIRELEEDHAGVN